MNRLDEDTFELAAQVRSAVVPLARALRQQVGDELTATQQSVFGSISRLGPVRMSELAAHEQLSPPMITRVVDALESRGLVERLRDASDGRACQVVASERGRAFLAESRERRDRWLAERLRDVSPSDRDALAAAIPIIARLVGSPS